MVIGITAVLVIATAFTANLPTPHDDLPVSLFPLATELGTDGAITGIMVEPLKVEKNPAGVDLYL